MKTIILLALLLAPTLAWADCAPSTDCVFDYTPMTLADQSRDNTLTIGTTSDLDIVGGYKTPTGAGATLVEATACPPAASEVCMENRGNGVYRIVVDGALVATSGDEYCLDVQDAQGSPTVFDERICQVVGGGTSLTAQQVADAALLAPVGSAAAGSQVAKSDAILADTADMQPKMGTPATDLAADIANAGLTQQQIADALKQAPSVGAPAVGSVAEELDTIKAKTRRIR